MIDARATRTALAAGALLLGLCAGCGKAPRPAAAASAPAMPAVSLDTPADAARSLLECLRGELDAVARNDQAAQAQYLETLRTLAAAESIKQRMADLPHFKLMLGDDLVAGVIHNWGAMLAYYADGLRLDQLRQTSVGRTAATVIVPASGPADEALLQITCVREGDGPWRVRRLDFVTEMPKTGPTSAPATAPASQPAQRQP